MKKRMLLGLSLVVTLIVFMTGVTMAWFTDSKEVTNSFTAGTVKLNLEEVFTSPGNWNPGDETPKDITLKNDGTKAIYVRVKLEPKWNDKAVEGGAITPNELATTNVTYEPVDANWVKVGDYFYYKNILGSNLEVSNNSKEVTLKLKVKLKGEETGNDYQGKVFTLKATAEAIQAKNGAAQDQWSLSEANMNSIGFEAYPQ